MRKRSPKPWDYTIDIERENTESYRRRTDTRERLLLKSREHTRKTEAEISPERDERRKLSEKEKIANTHRLNELEKYLSEYTAKLETSMLSSMEEIGVPATIKKYSNDLNTLRELSYEHYRLLNRPANIPYFYALFISLCRQNSQFLLFAPKSVFIYGESLPLEDLSKNDRLSLQKRLEEDVEIHAPANKYEREDNENIFGNASFRNRYIKYFPSHILEMSKFSDVVYALHLYPQYYVEFRDRHSNLYQTLMESDKLISQLFKIAPKVALYMTAEEFNQVAKIGPRYIGRAIKNDPDVVKLLPKDFFKKYSPKFVFNGVATRKEVCEMLGDRADLFPELKKFVEGVKESSTNIYDENNQFHAN